MKPRIDDGNTELASILDDLLSADVNITVREVARRHTSLSNASAFSRDPERMRLIERAQVRQRQLRTKLNPHVAHVTSLSAKLEQSSQLVKELEAQVRALVASHTACIQAVMQSGGMDALQRFWRDYKAVEHSLRAVSAFPDCAEAVNLRRVQGNRGADTECDSSRRKS